MSPVKYLSDHPVIHTTSQSTVLNLDQTKPYNYFIKYILQNVFELK